MLLAVGGLAIPAQGAIGDPLVVNPFVSTGYNNWIDVIKTIGPYPVSPGLLGGYTKEAGTQFTNTQGPEQNWGIQIRDGALNEASDGRPGTGGSHTCDYLAHMMVQDEYVTPSEYTFTTRMYSYDDDGFGTIFGYQDPYNMFRVGIRAQASGSLGFDNGIHVSKIVGGQLTKLAQTNSLGVNGPITDDPTTGPDLIGSNYRNAPHGTLAQPLDVTVVVNGNNWQVKMAKNGVPLIHDDGAGTTTDVLLSGQDDDLAPGKVGVQTWYAFQESNSNTVGGMQCGAEFESVVVPMQHAQRRRKSVCISCQVGCRYGCRFCQTATLGLVRNLTAAEMVGQVLAAQREFGPELRTVVFMGMGEPLDNLDEVLQALRVLNDPSGIGLKMARLTLSTVGRVDGLRRIAELGWRRLNLAVSINAPNDELRHQIMPIAREQPLSELRQAMLDYPLRRNQHFMVEYVLIPGVNDEPRHARQLAELLAGVRCMVNVIAHNPRPGSAWRAPHRAEVRRFLDELRAAGQPCRQRVTRGREELAACGQLGTRAAAVRSIAC